MRGKLKNEPFEMIIDVLEIKLRFNVFVYILA